MLKNVSFVFVLLLLCFPACFHFTKSDCDFIMITSITSIHDIHIIFPTKSEQIKTCVPEIMQRARQEVRSIVDQDNSKRNFTNTFEALDQALLHISIPLSAIEALLYLSPDEKIRNAAQEATVELKQFVIDTLSQNVELYQACKYYVEYNLQYEQLKPEQRYFIEETMHSFKKEGLDLSQDIRDKIGALKKDLAQLTTQFEDNVNTDKSFITATKEELAGLADDFVDNLKKDEAGNYILGVDYPTYFMVMEHGSISKTRKKMSRAFNNRAYPKNIELLETIIAKRDQLAKLLGFDSYAALDINHQMAEEPQRVQSFLQQLSDKAAEKEDIEFDQLIADLPQGVELTPEGKIKPWDMAYTTQYFKKKYFNIDEREVAEYFPLERTVKGLFEIYQQFFDIQFKESTINLWIDNLTLIEVSKDNNFLGYIILDLYPRDNKFGHACAITIVPSIKLPQQTTNGALAIVVANFPPSTSEKPSLLQLEHDVKTFFHEFGHALHAILGATELSSFSGTSVKTDFVELPSQMLEEWLTDKTILKQLSSHYQTGKPLSDELITQLLKLKQFNSGHYIQQQIFYALISLNYFLTGEQKNSIDLFEQLYKKYRRHILFDPENHFQASFGHLMEYGSKYYSYLWSKVFALDLFDYIKKYGLRNPEIGREYRNKIIGKGGSKDPNELLVDFLGREPNQEAFLKSLGL